MARRKLSWHAVPCFAAFAPPPKRFAPALLLLRPRQKDTPAAQDALRALTSNPNEAQKMIENHKVPRESEQENAEWTRRPRAREG